MGQRPNDLTPCASPFHLLGAEIRRHREERGMSLADLEALVTYNRSHLARWERAERQPTREHVTEIDRTLHASGALVRLYEYAEASETQGAARGQVAVDVANHDLHVANQVATMASGESGTAGWSQDDMIAVPAWGPNGTGPMTMVDIERRAFLLGGLGATAGVAGLAGESSASSATPPAGTDLVQHFRSAKIRLMDRDNLRGPAATISDAQKNLVAMADCIQDMSGEDRRRLTEVRTQFADLAGWLYQDSGHREGASFWLSQSIEMSHFVGDQQVTAFMLARRSQMCAELEDPHEALDAALASVKMARPGSRISAVAHTFAGHAYALLGDQPHSTEHYETAHATVDQMEERGPGAAYALFMGPAYVNSYHAHSLARLRDYSSSAERFTEALSQLDPGMHRDRGVYTAWLAQSLAGAGDDDRASQRGMEALAIASGTGSARIMTELRSLSDQLPKTGSAVTTFRGALQDLEEKES